MQSEVDNDDVVVVEMHYLGMYNESLNPLKKNVRISLVTIVYKPKAVPLWHSNCAWPSREDTLSYT